MKRDASATRVPMPAALPRISRWQFLWFAKYAASYLRQNVHAVRISRAGPPPALGDHPAVIYLNHPSWWDPLVGLFLAAKFWPDRMHYAAIDAAALARYRFFERIGFFGIEPGTLRGARRFLALGRGVLTSQRGMLWVTAQGQFADCRARPVELRRGLAHLATHSSRGLIVPLALEYAFWQERFPEVLVRFGEPIDLTSSSAPSAVSGDVGRWHSLLTARLEATQDSLAREAIAQDATCFDRLESGRAGVGGIYEQWLRLRAWRRGKQFQREHAAVQR